MKPTHHVARHPNLFLGDADKDHLLLFSEAAEPVLQDVVFALTDCSIHWLNRKNCCVPVMGLVTVFCPLTTTDERRFVLQTGAKRFVVD